MKGALLFTALIVAAVVSMTAIAVAAISERLGYMSEVDYLQFFIFTFGLFFFITVLVIIGICYPMPKIPKVSLAIES